MRNWYTMKVVEDDEDDEDEDKKNPFAEIVIYDAIGKSFWDDQAISAKSFIDALAALDPEVENITLRVNSPGGDVFDGVAIYNALKNHKAKVTAHVDGIAASIASVIVMAADKIVMPSNAFMLVHNSMGFSMGTAEDMHALAADLERIDKSITATYVARTGTTAAKVRALMKEDRLMDAKEAKDLGFADEVTAPVKAQAHSQRALGLLPKAVAERFCAEAAQGDPPADPLPPPAPAKPDQKEQGSEEPKTPDPSQKPPKVVAIRDEAKQAGIAEHKAYVTSITDLCTLARAPEKVGAYVRAGTPVDQVRNELLTHVAEQPVLSQHPMTPPKNVTASWKTITDKINARTH